MKLLSAALLLVLALSGLALAQTPAEPPTDPSALPRAVVDTGATVRIEYTLRDETGRVIDSNRGETPLTYKHGQHELVPGLERALDGMHVGETKSVRLPPDEGYGPVRPEAQTEVPREMIPSDSLEVGAELLARSSAGERMVRVKEIRDTTVVLDLNHPLAGQTLYFDVRVVDIAASEKP